MKTFKLKALRIIESVHNNIKVHNINLIDGLTINREDEQNRWVIEAYISRDYMELFKRLHKEREEIMVEANITKESNEPATFITSIIGLNEIGDQMNVLLIGTIVDRRKNKIEEMLRFLVNKGYQGEELLGKFKEML